MNHRVGVAVLSMCCVFSLNCGPVWDGRYVGTLTTSGTCSDGSAIPPGTNEGDWVLDETGQGLSVQTNGSCGTFMADITGDLARPRGKSCAPFSGDGFSFSPAITGGTISLNDKAIVPNVQQTIIVSGAASATCRTSTTGIMTRR